MGHIRQRSPDAELFLSPANTKGEMFGRKSKLELLVDDFQPSNHLIHRNLLPIGHDTEIDEQEDEYTLMPEDQELGKGREQTYEQVLALRELQKLPRNRVAIECIVAIDVKTNIVVRTFITLPEFSIGCLTTFRSLTNTPSSLAYLLTSRSSTNARSPP